MRLHADMAELIRLGAYRSGANAELDRAIAVHPALERILRAGRRTSAAARRRRSRRWRAALARRGREA